MKYSVLVSIIMPVYNAEKFLMFSIDSVINQGYTNWELICIDDGSCDKSGEILDSYAEKDSRVKVIHQENHGVSYSRQLGINMAQGIYCTHLDSDDWLEPEAIQSMVDHACSTNSDMVWCDLFINQSDVWKFECEENPKIMIGKILRQEIWGSLCNKIIRTAICKRKDIFFPENCSMWEDMSFLVQCLLYTKKISYIRKPLYHYRQVEGSLTHQNSTRIMCYEYKKAVDSIARAISDVDNRLLNKDLITLKLFVIKDYIDDLRIRDYEKFVNTYPDAYSLIFKEKNYPLRLKVSAWLINNNYSFLIPLICKVDSVLRRLHITKQ